MSSAALQQYVALASCAKGPLALCHVLQRAIAAKDVYTFGELLDLPAVQQVRALMFIERFASDVQSRLDLMDTP